MNIAAASIALSGILTASQGVQVAAHNTANLGTEGFRRQELERSERPGGGVTGTVVRADAGESFDAVILDRYDALLSRLAFQASVAAFKSNDQALGTLLDVRA